MSCQTFICTAQGISSGLNSFGNYQSSIEHSPASRNNTSLWVNNTCTAVFNMQMASLITHLMDLNLIGVLDEYANRHSNLRQINTHPLKQGRELETKLGYMSVSFFMAVFIRFSFSKERKRFQMAGKRGTRPLQSHRSPSKRCVDCF